MAGEPPRSGRVWLWAAMAAHVLFAAGTYVISKPAALGFDDPAGLTLARALIASVMLLALTGWAVPPPRFRPREWLQILFLGVLLVPLNQYPFLYGMQHTAPGHPALLYSMTPLGVLLLSALLQGRWPARTRCFGIALALTGLCALLRPWDESALARELRIGDLWIGGAVAGWVVYTVAARSICRKHSPATVTSWSLVAGAAVMIPFGLEPMLAQDYGALRADAWLGLFWVAGITSVAMMLLWNHLLKHLDSVEVAICSNAQPPVAALLSAAAVAIGLEVGAIDLGPMFWVGMALVLGGMRLVQRRGAAG